MTPVEFGPADRPGANHDDPSITSAMRADAGGMRIRRDQRAAERKTLCLRRRQIGRLACARKRQTGRDPRQVERGEARLLKAQKRGLKDGGKARVQPKPDIGGAGYGLAQPRAGERAQPRAAFCSAAVNAEKERVCFQGRSFAMVSMLNAQERFSIEHVVVDVPPVVRPMETERASPRYSGIDLWEPGEILDAMIEAQFAAVAATRAARPALERAARAMEARIRYRGRLVYAGAGTSGRLAVQDGAELMPTFSWPEQRLVLLMAGGKEALLRSIEGAEDEVSRAERLVREHVIDGKDALIAVAASGTTPFTLACLREAKRRGALTIGIANNPGTPVLLEADHPIWLDTGAEPIAGSTRLKAGTAQKIALNLLSTLVMILLGRVYQGLMVDVQAVNEKLVRRSEDMLVRLTGDSHEAARDALQHAHGSVKLAVMLLRGCKPEEGARLIDSAGGKLRSALAMFERHETDAA